MNNKIFENRTFERSIQMKYKHLKKKVNNRNTRFVSKNKFAVPIKNVMYSVFVDDEEERQFEKIANMYMEQDTKKIIF